MLYEVSRSLLDANVDVKLEALCTVDKDVDNEDLRLSRSCR